MSGFSCERRSSSVRPATENERSDDVLVAGMAIIHLAHCDRFGQRSVLVFQNASMSSVDSVLFRYASTSLRTGPGASVVLNRSAKKCSSLVCELSILLFFAGGSVTSQSSPACCEFDVTISRRAVTASSFS